MRAYIHYSGGRPWNEECETAERGFRALGIECVPFSDNEGLEGAEREDVVVAGMLVTEHALALRGAKPDPVDYPRSLEPYLGRSVWRARVADIDEGTLPLFAKPAREKEVPGRVAVKMRDLEDVLAFGPDYELLCSEALTFTSEWRCFVRYGRVVGIAGYAGDDSVKFDADVVRSAVAAYTDALAGYSADFGVTDDGRTVLIEVNDGFALGCYGLNPVAYALLLSARWAEMVGAADPLRDVTPDFA